MPYCVKGRSYATTACLCSCHFRSRECDDASCASAAGVPLATPVREVKRPRRRR